jgi:predicted short-subunit dehydrogenase-like oxidoreductase (DUF2520 family)
MDDKFKIVIIGAGNVAFSLAYALQDIHIPIHQIYARNESQLSTFCALFSCDGINEIEDISNIADFYFLCVNDDSIALLSEQLSKYLPNNKIVMHTSGSRGKNEINDYFINSANFYPLQTLTKSNGQDWQNIPIFIEANEESFSKISALAKLLSSKIYKINDEVRIAIHVAAVFVNNFTNANFIIAKEVLNSKALNLDILMPLIRKSIESVQNKAPEELQTGPARRNDVETIHLHQLFLEKFSKEVQEVYRSNTNFILNKFLK